METLVELFRYNAWANCRVLDACAALPVSALGAAQPAMYGTVLTTVAHIIGVEVNYLRLIEGEETARQQFEALDAARERCLATDDAYVRLVEGLTDADLGRTFHMPGLGRDLTVRQALIQVALHSTEHRADVAAAITRLGGTPPPLDYVQYLEATAGR
jgi:uncharacterized damage-inducible protein DinB